MALPQVNQFTPQVYSQVYLSLNDTPQTEVHELNVHQISGSSDVTTIMREWAGVSKGSGRTEVSFRFRLPYRDSDTGGVGFNTGGDTAAGIALQNTMITNANLVNNAPMKFTFGLGSPATQKYICKGFIKDINVTYSDSSAIEVAVTAVGQLSFWQ